MPLASLWSPRVEATTWEPVVTVEPKRLVSEWSGWAQARTYLSGVASPSPWSSWAQALTWGGGVPGPSAWSPWSAPVGTASGFAYRLASAGWAALRQPFYRKTPTGWTVVGSRSAPPVVVEPGLARQIFGMIVQADGAAMSSPVNQAGEDARMANLLGWNGLGGPQVQRIFRTTQTPPYTDLDRAVSQGRMPWLSLKPNNGGLVGDKNGNNDAYWASWGQYFASFGPDNEIWFSYDHENDRFQYSGATARSNPAWVAYQDDYRNAFARIVSVMKAADPVNNLAHVKFGPILTGYAFRGNSNRDPGMSWHPNFDFMASDPYDFWLYNNGQPYNPRRDLFSDGSLSTGAREHYEFCTNPVGWYQKYHPTWPVPPLIAQNLNRFPTRVGIGETGTCFDMEPNSNNTQWVTREDPNSLQSYQAKWITQMGKDLREKYPRVEVVCYYHAGTQPIGSNSGHPVYFAGPAANRWGAQFSGSIAAYKAEVLRDEHHGELTPWTPAGLA